MPSIVKRRNSIKGALIGAVLVAVGIIVGVEAFREYQRGQVRHAATRTSKAITVTRASGTMDFLLAAGSHFLFSGVIILFGGLVIYGGLRTVVVVSDESADQGSPARDVKPATTVKWPYLMVALLLWCAAGFWLMNWGSKVPPAPTFDRVDFVTKKISWGWTVYYTPAGKKGEARPVGVLVRAVDKGGAAELAGLQAGDILVAMNGTKLDDLPMLDKLLVERSARFSVVREGKPFETTVTAQELSIPEYKLVEHVRTFPENALMIGKVMLGCLPIWGIVIRRFARSNSLGKAEPTVEP
ncbi:MAG TPA: PDZ domain-containing protein [Lacunisphaera sp.]|nr:PDZ domain-containing protein [Lacunisphaera sp.]